MSSNLLSLYPSSSSGGCSAKFTKSSVGITEKDAISKMLYTEIFDFIGYSTFIRGMWEYICMPLIIPQILDMAPDVRIFVAMTATVPD